MLDAGRMDRRLLLGVAIVAALLMAVGLLGADRPLAEWVRASGIEDARVFAWGLAALDTISGMRLWIWLLGVCALGIGLLLMWRRRADPLGHALVTAALVQFATVETMIIGKEYFGRLRPHEVLASGDWTHVWFAGGVSYPSGHSAFYFGFLLPLAAATSIRWLRVVLIATAAFVVIARVDMAKHFLSDISASALVAAIYSLIAATLVRRWLPAPARA